MMVVLRVDTIKILSRKSLNWTLKRNYIYHLIFYEGMLLGMAAGFFLGGLGEDMDEGGC